MILGIVADGARADDQQILAARCVLERTLGSRARDFRLERIAPDDGRDVFTIQASGGAVRVAGSSGVAVARGAYEYLKRAAGCQVTWDGAQINLPDKLPDFEPLRVVCPHRYRHYFNVCTFGYTMAFWDWPRWEREIDWMALHGINMPLAMTGQEAVWQRVWREFGLTDEQVRRFFTGAAFLPWHWMGNIDAHMGPLPQSFIDFHFDLQKKILARERELGMTPVTPAFAGFVPNELAALHPQAKISRSTAWCGFEPTRLLNPRDPLFEKIGKRFIEEYRAAYGTNHLYLADVFNEMTPQVSADARLTDLEAVGKAIFRALVAGDSDGVWVMQGWLFLNEAAFWKGPEVDAFLRAVPDERMVLLDLSCEATEIWRKHEPFRRKPWIFNFLHNFGGHTAVYGDAQRYIDTWHKALRDPDRGRMSGMGLTMEGIEQNAWLYELATDLMWRDEPITFDAWVAEWCRQRYGPGASASAIEAWKRVPKDGYPTGWSQTAYARRPQLESVGEPGADIDTARQRLELLYSARAAHRDNQLFQRDLVDAMKRYLARIAELWQYRAVVAKELGDKPEYQRAAAGALGVLDDLDRLLATRPEYRLSRWIEQARDRGATPDEKDQMERNARTQITVWGGPILNDYAAKEWSGLVGGFYRERLRRFFDELARDDFDSAATTRRLADWESGWAMSVGGVAARPAEDTIAVAESLFEKYGDFDAIQIDRGIAVGKPASDSGHTEVGGDPSKAVDGDASGGYWAASPYPQWWQVDLQKTTRIGRIQVFLYAGDERHYKYTVEVSLDGESWTRAVDMATNTRRATARGDDNRFSPIDARYVRVNMMFNSANVGVHLREVRVFAAP